MAAAGGSFSDEEFWKACAELQQPAVAGKWELLLETSGISVYRLLEESTWLYKYKIFGVLKDCSPALLTEVFMDLGYRKQWDQYVNELYEKECDGETLVYWQVAYPFPMYNRDMPSVPQLRKSWREQNNICWEEKNKRLGRKPEPVFMYYFDNPGGLIPSWLINWVARNGVPSFLKDLEEAYHKYPKKK
uniref:phosphatidylcholine transfer protein isoform X3 n=1 Tax=Ictidomys tridecemlineatus TaxID=43179 RepID=UPI001A9F3076|nr:phosphatidylcholine transfer protein isoform X3 [Ictidomys tridecemlineatus]